MRVIIRPTASSASLYVANLILARITAFAPSAERPFVLGLPTGSSPLEIYQHLIAFHQGGLLSFEHIITFNMDEYLSLPASHAQSYHTFMFAHLFAHVDIPARNVHFPTERGYDALIRSLGGVNLFLCGVGASGHLAFNESFSSLRSRTRAVVLAPSTLAANARFFGGDPAAVPKRAVTVGVATVLDAAEVVVIATGAAKARAVRDGIEGGMGHACVLSALQGHGNAVVVVDEDATDEMKVGTVKYFKQVEEEEEEDGLDGEHYSVGVPLIGERKLAESKL